MDNRSILISMIIVLNVVTFGLSHSAFAQSESPYSFAAGRKMNEQKEENALTSVSEDILTTLRGPRGESLAIASTGLALFSFLTGLKAGAIVFGVMAVLFLSLSHPYLALALAIVGLAIHKYRTRYDDDDFDFKAKDEDSEEKDSKKKDDSSSSSSKSETSTSTKKESGPPPKISRPI